MGEIPATLPRRYSILVVEDDAVTRAMLVNYMGREGFEIIQAESVQQMYQVLGHRAIDLILLDLYLPDGKALDLIGKIRVHSNVGIIVITSAEDEIDKIIGLELGADDYIYKPVNFRELAARARNVLRRSAETEFHKNDAGSLRQFDGWTLDLNRRRLTDANGQECKLTKGEFDLLNCLSARPGQVLSRKRLVDMVNPRQYDPDDRTIDVLIGRLRRKIEIDAKDPKIIITVFGVGYQFAGKAI